MLLAGVIRKWRGRWHEAALVVGIAVGYTLYLFASQYQNLYYDAELYWKLGHRFYQDGHFSLLAYDDSLRGYAYPLLNFVSLAVRKALHLPAVVVVKVLNAAMAGLLFGLVGPRVWQAATGAGQPPAIARRLVWAGLVFIFWRDYFNFSLSDFPALLALAVALWQVQRRRVSGVALAGMALALALNIRPIYLVAVPPVLALALLGHTRSEWLRRLAVLALGAGLVLTPQWLINRRHFGANTPLVLSRSKELLIHNLYLKQLKWGLLYRKYETSVGRELPTGQILFLDEQGRAVLQAEQVDQFESASQYLRTVAHYPGVLARTYAWHLFSGLDISHPTPYLRRWAPAPWLAALNYSLWFWAALVVIGGGWPTRRQALMLAALLLSCLAVLPLAMEVRFLLPLHLLLLALVAFGAVPGWAMASRARLIIVGVSYVVFLPTCFHLSARVLRTIEPRFEAYLLPASGIVGSTQSASDIQGKVKAQ